MLCIQWRMHRTSARLCAHVQTLELLSAVLHSEHTGICRCWSTATSASFVRYVLVMRYGQLVGVIKKKDILRYIASEVHGLRH